MELNPQTIDAIKSDEFAVATLNAVKSRLLELCIDWHEIDAEAGLPPFRTEDDLTLYTAVCTLLNDGSTPDLSGTKVNIGGAMVSAGAVLDLARAVKK